jgi:hypothetical protein
MNATERELQWVTECVVERRHEGTTADDSESGRASAALPGFFARRAASR